MMLERLLRDFGLRSSYEWSKLARIDIRGIDPDGWDRKNLERYVEKNNKETISQKVIVVYFYLHIWNGYISS